MNASDLVVQDEPSNVRTAATNSSPHSSFATGLASASAANVSSVTSKRSFSGRSTVMRW